MNKNLQARIDLFVDSTNSIKKEFLMPHRMVKQMAALLHTVDGKPVETEYIRTCYDLLKKNTGPFSFFRSHLALALAAMLALSGNPETQLENTLAAYDALKKAKFRRSDFLTVAAFELAAKADHREYDAVAEKARAFYKGMKRSKPWITGEDDYIYSVMLALSDMDIDTGLAHMEELYAELKPHLRNRNSIQSLSQVMAVSNAPKDSAARILELRGATAAAGIRMDRQYTLSSLGVLALLPGSADEIAADIKDAYQYLRKQRGFGGWSDSKQTLLLMSAALVSSVRAEQVENDLMNSTVATNFNNIIIAEYTAILVTMVAITASTTASSSSSS